MKRFCILLLPTAIFSFTETAQSLRSEVLAQVCPLAQACAFQIDSVVRHRDLWAVAFTVGGAGAKKKKDIDALRQKLQEAQYQILEITPDKTLASAFYRLEQKKFQRVSADAFFRETLNPKGKIVVRYSLEFLNQGGNLEYRAPQTWESDGLAAASTETLALTVAPGNLDFISIALVDLSDKPVPKLAIAACRLRNAPCNSEAISVKGMHDNPIEIDIKAARKLPSDQPAFKVVIKGPDGSPLAQLAIPYKPQPNFVMFGITGFLFGGVIALMMLLMRRFRKGETNG